MKKAKKEDKKDYIPIEWLKQIRLRHKELSDKNFDWKSFYNGAVEGFYMAYAMGLITIPQNEK